jgi:hypothetical protein
MEKAAHFESCPAWQLLWSAAYSRFGVRKPINQAFSQLPSGR